MNQKLFELPIKINLGWCKSCGICMAICKKGVIGADKRGKATVIHPDNCSRCRMCEMSCPDFAIFVDVTSEKEVTGNE